MLTIEAEIENVKYHPQLCKSLEQVSLQDFRSGLAFRRASFLVEYAPQKIFAISHWRSPKRTRTYPYARVYDTLAYDSRVTIVPFGKDEGFQGDRDFLQWDTVSLMSLLKVYVIPAYYKSAIRSKRYPDKITQQSFDYEYLFERLTALAEFNQSDAVHWNMNEIREQGPVVAKQAASYYAHIAEQTGVRMHSLREMDKRIAEMFRAVETFRARSRAHAQSAQGRESKTIHSSERLSGDKAIITIKNFIGGYYFWTVDEAQIADGRLFLIEKKHSKGKILPSLNDIKDAFLRMVLFSNLANLTVGGKKYKPYPVIGLTSDLLRGVCHSKMNEREIERFFGENQLQSRARELVVRIFGEGRMNNFVVLVGAPDIDAVRNLL